MDVRINRLASSDGARVTTLHIVSWKAEDGEIARTEVPLWLMRFSSINMLSHLGVVPSKIRLTVQDVERYGPGIVTTTTSQAPCACSFGWIDRPGNRGSQRESCLIVAIQMSPSVAVSV